MRPQHLRLAAVGAAVIAAAAMTACGSSAAPAGTTTSSPPASTSPASTPAASFSTADVAFATGMLRLEGQSRAMAALVAGHTTNAALRQFAGHLRGHDTGTRHMRDLMGEWRQPAPGATASGGMGPGMMGTRDWDEMTREHGRGFNGHWLDAMIANHAAEITLCRAELRSGTSPQGRALARTMLAQRLAELAQLQRWHHDHQHNDAHH
jgi:uncharacterized protein (DUF305 family)